MAGGAGLSFAIYRTLGSLVLAFLPIAIIMSFSSLLAFYKINNKPFIFVVEAAFKYFFSSKLYIWKKKQNEKTDTAGTEEDVKKYASLMVPKISDSKLKDLTWSLDIKESMYSDRNQK